MAKQTRFTIYDVLDSNGVFARNPANVGAVDDEGNVAYAGPVPYPKMFYHPKGEARVVVPAEIISTPEGPKRIGEQREIIWRIAKDKVEGDKLVAAGWHDHPAKAMAAAGLEAPSMGIGEQVAGLEAEIAELKRKLAAKPEDEDDLPVMGARPAPAAPMAKRA